MDIDEKLRLGGRLGNKKCSGCGLFKPLAEFYKRRDSRLSGYNSYCKVCHSLRKKEQKEAKK